MPTFDVYVQAISEAPVCRVQKDSPEDAAKAGWAKVYPKGDGVVDPRLKFEVEDVDRIVVVEVGASDEYRDPPDPEIEKLTSERDEARGLAAAHSEEIDLLAAEVRRLGG